MSSRRQHVSTGSPFEPKVGISRAVRAGNNIAVTGTAPLLSDVTRTRILLTRIEDWERVATVHGEFFRSIRPANTIMQVVRFIDPHWLVEIEADAVVEARNRSIAGRDEKREVNVG